MGGGVCICRGWFELLYFVSMYCCTLLCCTVALLLCSAALLPLCLGTITREYPHGHLLLVALGIGKTRGMVLEEAGLYMENLEEGNWKAKEARRRKVVCLR